MNIIENNIISTLIYSIGVQVGAKKIRAPLMLNWLQQHPKFDPMLGDLLLSNGGFSVIMEFKRASNTSTKEYEKFKRLNNKLDEIGEHDKKRCCQIMLAAPEVHFFIESLEETTTVDLKVDSYWGVWSKMLAKDHPLNSPFDASLYSFSSFSAELANRISLPECKELKEKSDHYIQFLRDAYPKSICNGDSTGGVVIVNAGTEGLSAIIINDFTDLNRTISEINKGIEETPAPTTQSSPEEPNTSSGFGL